MRCVVQRVRSASVTVEEKVVGSIKEGLLVLCGFLEDDTKEKIDWVANKIAKLRIFNDENDKLNLSVKDVGGEVLIVSNFTLYGDCNNGHRPNFSLAAKGEISRPLYQYFVKKMEEMVPVQTGMFGEHMEMKLDFNGPITVIINR